MGGSKSDAPAQEQESDAPGPKSDAPAQEQESDAPGPKSDALLSRIVDRIHKLRGSRGLSINYFFQAQSKKSASDTMKPSDNFVFNLVTDLASEEVNDFVDFLQNYDDLDSSILTDQ